MRRSVLILEPDLDGHHAFWLAMLIEAYQQAGWSVEVLTAEDTSRLRIQAELRGFKLDSVKLHTARQAGDADLLCQARSLAADSEIKTIFVAFLDRFWAVLLAERQPQPKAKITGIWFHPHALDQKWRWAPPLGKRWKLRGRLHRFIQSFEAKRKLASIYFLVGAARERWLRLAPGMSAHVLPDPFEREPRLSKDEARRTLGLPKDRLIFLHLGSAERRKGLPDAVEVFRRLSEQPSQAWPKRPLLLRVGPNDRLSETERRRLGQLAKDDWALVRDTFVPATELMEYFAACDWVLIPYRKFRYSSGVLANAIGARRQVIAYDYGEVGRVTKAERLGKACRHGSQAALRDAVCEVCLNPPEDLSENSRRLRSSGDFIAYLSATIREDENNA